MNIPGSPEDKRRLKWALRVLVGIVPMVVFGVVVYLRMERGALTPLAALLEFTGTMSVLAIIVSLTAVCKPSVK